VKIVENTLGTWWAKAYHEMNPLGFTSGAPSNGFTINVNSPSYEAKFTNYMEGKVQILKNGKTAEARFGMYECWESSFGWFCDHWAYAKKDTDGTHTFASGSNVYHIRYVPIGDPDFRTGLHSMGSLFECMTTGTGGGVQHTKCDAYDDDKYWKSNQLRMQWPYIEAFTAQATSEISSVQTSALKPVEIAIDFAIQAEDHIIVAERGQPVSIPLKVSVPVDTEKELKIKLAPERGNADPTKFNAELSKQSLSISKNDVSEGRAIPVTSNLVFRDAGILTLIPATDLRPGEYTFAIEAEQRVDMESADALVTGTLVRVQVK